MKTAVLSIATAALALYLTACGTTPPMQVQENPLRSAKRDNYFVILRFLDEGALAQRYGGVRYNAFIARPRSMTPSRFLVFKLNIEEVKQPLFLKLNQIVLTLGPVERSPMASSDMKQYWEFEDPDQAIGQLDKDQRDKYLREELMPDEVSIPAGARVSRLIVFNGNFPHVGEARLYLPLFDPQRKVVEKLQFTFTFD
jgi:hypothetical protein